MNKTDKTVIEAFVEFLRGQGFPDLVVDHFPDERIRDAKAIDAIAGRFAIEHTSLDALDGQRERNAQWARAVGGLEDELRGQMSSHLSISTSYQAVTKGQDWSAIRAALKRWLKIEAGSLPNGMQDVTIPGVPFTLKISKSDDRPAGVYFKRTIQDTDETLGQTIGPVISKKSEKLAPHQDDGRTTVLVLESNDIALMNHVKVLEAIEVAFPDGWPSAVDQIWYADTTMWPSAKFFDLTALRAVERRD